MARVCAILPTFNRADLIPVALASIMRQTVPVDEIIVINDGSTDDTLQVLAGYESKISVYSQPNSGKAAGMNLGLSKATADYLWFFDDDDIAADDGIAPLVAALDNDPELDFVYGGHEAFHDDRVAERHLPEFWAMPVPDRPLLNFIGNLYPYQGGMLVRRKLFDRIGNFDTNFVRCQDVEMLLRMAVQGKSLYVPHIVFYQRGHSGSRYVAGKKVSADEALMRAVVYDQKALLLHEKELTLERVTPTFAAALPEASRRRSAHLHRASMYARRALWPQALDDLEAAAKIPAGPALPQDLDRLAYCIVKGQMFDLLSQDPQSMNRLRALHRSSAFGKAVVSALLRPIPWHIRTGLTGGAGTGWSRLTFALKTLGIGGLTSLVLAKKFS